MTRRDNVYLAAMPSRRDLLILGGLTALAAVVRFATLDLQGFHHDEAVTASRVLAGDFSETLGYVADNERSPPLYYVLAWAWAQVFGLGEVGLRSLSALVGTLTVPAAFFAGRALAGRSPSAPQIGLLLAAFVALNPYLVWYSQEARSYGLMVLFSTLALGYFARSAREPNTRNLGGWVVASGAALLSHYFAAFLIVGQGAWLLWKAGSERKRVVFAGAAIALVALALLPLARGQQGEGRRDGFTEIALAARAGEVPLNYVASEEPDPLAGSSQVDAVQVGAAAAGGALFVLALFLILRRSSEDEREGAVLSGVALAAAVLVPLALAVVGIDFLNPRNLIAGTVPALGVAAVGFGVARSGSLGRVGAGATVALFSVVLTAVFISREMQREDWRGAAEAMGSSTEDRLIVTNRNGDDPLSYYLGAEKFEGGRFKDGVRVSEVLALSTSFNVAAPPGFERIDEQGLAPIFLLTRFESDQPVRLSPKDLQKDVLTERSATLFDPGSR